MVYRLRLAYFNKAFFCIVSLFYIMSIEYRNIGPVKQAQVEFGMKKSAFGDIIIQFHTSYSSNMLASAVDGSLYIFILFKVQGHFLLNFQQYKE